jgi:hypothetical protein
MDSSKLNNYLVENTPTCYSTILFNFIKDNHGWNTKKDDLIKKGLQRTILDFYYIYNFMTIMDWCMIIIRMMSC